MGKLNVEQLRKLTAEDFRVLTAVEMAMRNHEIVPLPLVAQMAQVQRDGISKLCRALCLYKLLSYERSKKFDGYRLTNMGYDFLALNAFRKRDTLTGFGHQIGVGKESNIYKVSCGDDIDLVLKLHRLGRTCFRNIKDLRDYHGRRKHASWLYLSRISATKEFAYLKALYDNEFPVPRPVDFNRHCIVMSLVKGRPLNHVKELENVEALYDTLMNLIVRLAEYGVIHGDFNEFNIMIAAGTENPVVIDFPQMISTSHPNAETYFNRDVECIKTFFSRRFNYESELFPTFEDIERTNSLDKDVRCSGFTKKMAKDMDELLEAESETDQLSEIDETGSEEGDEDEEGSVEDENVSEQAENQFEDLTPMPGSDGMENNSKIAVLRAFPDEENGGGGDVDDDDNFSVNQNVSDGEDSDESDRYTNRSYLSTASTIPPDEIKRRVKSQSKVKVRKQERRMCKVKGKDSAVARNRRECSEAVKFSATSMWGME